MVRVRLAVVGRRGRAARAQDGQGGHDGDAHAIDRDDAARLWEVSAALTGVDAFAAAA